MILIRRIQRFVCVLGVFGLSAVSVYGQVELDTMRIEEQVDTIFKDLPAPKTIKYNPADYIHQPRHLAQGKPFEGKWWRHLFMGLSSGFYGLSDKEWQRANVPFEGFIGYEFNPYHSLRLTGRYVKMSRPETRWDLNSFGVDLDYMFNLTNYLYGYDPYRFLEISLVPGIGYTYTHRLEERYSGPQAHFGIHIGFNFTHNAEVFIEPWAGGIMDRVNGSIHSGYYDFIYGVKMGANFKFHPAPDAASDTINHKPFFEYSQGMVAFHRPSETWGTGYQISVGTWLNPYVGIRAGLAGRNFYWSAHGTSSKNLEWHSGMFLGARIEALLNPLNFFEKWRSLEIAKKFGITLSLGGEYGWMIKYGMDGVNEGLRKYYFGVTAASQFHYALSRRTSIFIEPRVSLLKYSIPYSNIDLAKSYTEKEASMSMGVRLQPYSKEEILALDKDYDYKFSFNRFSLMAAFGGARHIRTSKVLGDASFNLNLQAGASYEISPLTSIRLRAEYLRYVFNQDMSYNEYAPTGTHQQSALFRNTNHILTTKLGYMLNLNNLIQGYDANRRFNVYFEAGPMFSWLVKRRVHFSDDESIPQNTASLIDQNANVKNSLGVYGGIVAEYKLDSHWSVLAQSEMSTHFSKNFLSAPSGFTSVRNNWLVQASVGAAYRFDDFRSRWAGGADGDTVNHKPFFEYSQGMVAIHRPSETWGTGYQISVGTWLNHFLGVRAGFTGRNFYWGAKSIPAVAVNGVEVHPQRLEWDAGTFMGARLEALLNPLNLFEQWRSKNSPFSVNLSMGVEAGRMIKYGTYTPDGLRRPYYSITGGAQFLYALSPRTEIYIEPRFAFNHYTLPESNMSGWKGYRDKELDLNFGVRVQPYNRYERRQNNSDYDYDFSFNRFSLMAAIGGARHIRTSKVLGDASFNVNLQAGVAYEMSPLCSFRLRAEYLRYVFNQQMAYTSSGSLQQDALFRNTHHILTTKLGYLLNLNNLLQGYDEDRRFNVFVEAGPMFSWMVKRRIHFHDDETIPGTGVSWQDPHANIKNSFGLFGAVVAEYKLDSHWSVLAQSEMSTHFRQNFLSAPSGFTSVRKNWLVQASVGAAYRFSDSRYRSSRDEADGDTVNHKPFFEYSQGMVAVHRPSDTWGTGYQGTIGMWINHYFGVRAGLTGRNFYWGGRTIPAVVAYDVPVHPKKTEWYAGTFMGVRLETLFNPLNLFELWRDKNSKFSVNLSAGIEAGRLIKYGTYSSEGLRRYYYGFTGATQILYALSRRTSVFIEPRMSLNNFTLPEDNMKGWKRYTDKELDLSFGVRVQPYSKDERKENNTYYDYSPSMSHLSVMAAVGGTRQVITEKVLGDGLFNVNAQIGAAYEFAPLSSARLRLEYLRLNSNREMSYNVYDFTNPIEYQALFRHTTHILSAKLGYMLNVNNLLQGYDANRKLNIFVEAGPMLSWALSRQYQFADGELKGGENIKMIDPDKDVNNAFGLFGCVVADYRLTPHWSVLAQSEMSGQVRKGFLQQSGFTSFRRNWLLQVSVGGAYHF